MLKDDVDIDAVLLDAIDYDRDLVEALWYDDVLSVHLHVSAVYDVQRHLGRKLSDDERREVERRMDELIRVHEPSPPRVRRRPSFTEYKDEKHFLCKHLGTRKPGPAKPLSVDQTYLLIRDLLRLQERRQTDPGPFLHLCLSDAYALAGDYNTAIDILEINEDRWGLRDPNWKLNLRLLAGNEWTPRDLFNRYRLLPISPNVPKSYGQRNIDRIEARFAKVLAQWSQQQGIGPRAYFSEKYRSRRTHKQELFAIYVGSPFVYFPQSLYDFTKIPEFLDFSRDINRQAENDVRKGDGVRQLADSAGELALYKRVSVWLEAFDVYHQARPQWLGRQHLDVYVPELKIALEFQGAQHDHPITAFGGEESYLKTQERDQRKQELCNENGVHLLYVRSGDVFSDVQERIRALSPGQTLP